MTKEIHDINTRALDFVVELIDYIFEYPDDDYMTMECLCRKLVKHGLLDKADGYYQTHDICTNTHECVKDTHDKTEPQYDAEEVAKDINRKVDMGKKEWNARHIDEFFREPTAEERKAVADYIDSISVPTGVNVFDFMDEPQTETEIAKAIVHKMIDDAVIAEDAYPDLRQKMHDAVDEYEPQTEREDER